MITTSSRTRIPSPYLIAVLAVTVVVFVALAVAQSIVTRKRVLIPATGGQNAQELFRQEELALYNRPAGSSIGGSAFYEYRRGEWSTGSVDAMGQFRQEELSLYDRPAASSLADPAFQRYLSTSGSSLADPAFHRYLSTSGSSLADPAFHRYLSTQGLGK